MRIRALFGMALIGLVVSAAGEATAAPETPAWQQAQQEQQGGDASAYAAQRLLEKARDLLDENEEDRAVTMLERITEQYPEMRVRFEAYLTLGKYHLEEKKYKKAIRYFDHLKDVAPGEKRTELEGDAQELYLQGLYYTGKAHFELEHYEPAFPALRKITENYPNTIWANQAYYYIGMCHFAQENWAGAIDALELVGTFVDPESPATEYVEAGRRFYVKVNDADLPILEKLGNEVRVDIRSESGDKERIRLIPLTEDEPIYLGSIPTEVGPAKKDDDKLQVIGGDTITTSYVDQNTRSGERDAARKNEVEVVSTATLQFTLGDNETKASAAFINSKLFVRLEDVDLDETAGRDRATIRMVSRYEREDAEEDGGGDDSFDYAAFMDPGQQQEKYAVRDELELTLEELGESKPIRSGEFVGSVRIVKHEEGEPIDKSDDQLAAMVGDQILATYTDKRHLKGETPREVERTAQVASEVSGRPLAKQYVVADPVTRAKKRLTEAKAYLELARIFKSMGLSDHAADKADQGLSRIGKIIGSENPVPERILSDAFKVKWQLELAKDELSKAIATCQTFNQMFPDSPLVDQALMGIAEIKMKRDDVVGALQIYRQILDLEQSQVKAEAQFRIAKAIEEQSKNTDEEKGRKERAVREYKKVAENYPDSSFAPKALGKLIDYYIRKKDYVHANKLLEEVFLDYPDSDFLDSMLLKWVMVSYRMGNYQKAHDKAKQLVFQYPGSKFADRAKKILPKLKQKVK